MSVGAPPQALIDLNMAELKDLFGTAGIPTTSCSRAYLGS